MGYTSFEYPRPLIIVRLRVGGVNANNFHSLTVGLDTGATITTVPTKVVTALGYDLSRPKRQQAIVTGSGIVSAAVITVSRLTAIGETVENTDVVCHDLPKNLRVEGLLGLNFLEHFNLNISFSTRIIEIHHTNTLPS
jgi:clan AA aspartic protease (TIGR02281 family)